jgi:peptide deformylase
MAILPIVRFPDPKLKQKSLPVSEPFQTIQPFLQDLIETLESYPGCVGLAAPQVGHLIRAIAVDVRRYRKPIEGHGLVTLLNPVILESHLPEMNREGCLSVSDYTGNVLRYQEVLVRGINASGQTTEIRAKGFEAVVMQHEIDHLDGMLFLDRVSSLKTDVFRRKVYLH